jgi:dTDP-N-acetylfucosamine:lipid II N-acetylfucosaminyltransferase
MKPNLHVMLDVNQSNWYIEKCIKYAPEAEDDFIAFGNPVKHVIHARFTAAPVSSDSFDAWAQKVNSGAYRQVIINYFDMHAAELVNRIERKDVAIVWVIWGADLYTLPFFWNKLYDQFAAKLYNVNWFQHAKSMYKHWKNRVRRGTRDHVFLYKAMRKVTHGATLVTPDVELVKGHLTRSIKQIPLSFSGVEDFQSVGRVSKNRTIQLGNSGDPANNHIEMLLLLKSLGIQNEIYMPIAYGSKRYLNVLPAAALEIFSENQLKLQTQIISKENYFAQLAATGFAVMGHLRQQAFANLIALFYFGTKVFMRDKNPLLKTFREWGLKVYSIEKDLSREELLSPLSEAIRESNRAIIEERLNEKSMRIYYRDLILGPRFNHEK